MEKKNILIKVLSWIGTVLVWLPILAPILLSAVVSIERRRFLFDYLMPAELFISFLVGGGLLVWAALRRHSRRKLIILSYAIALSLLAGGQALAVLTGLASGEIEPAGWQFAIVLASLAVYSLAVIVNGVGGILLLRDLSEQSRPPIK